MTKLKYQIGQKVILNCKNLVSSKHLDEDGWFGVTGTITDITVKRIKAVNDLRGTEGFYSLQNVKSMEQA